MSNKCEVCGRGPVAGKNVSHSHARTPRRWNTNIQKIKVSVNGTPKTMRVCTKCLKSGKVARI